MQDCRKCLFPGFHPGFVPQKSPARDAPSSTDPKSQISQRKFPPIAARKEGNRNFFSHPVGLTRFADHFSGWKEDQARAGGLIVAAADHLQEEKGESSNEVKIQQSDLRNSIAEGAKVP